MKQMKIEVGADGESTLSPPTSEDINGVVLAANIAESITIPSGARFAMFNATADFYGRYTGAAAVITDTTDGSGSGLTVDIATDGSGHTTFVIMGNGYNYVVDEEPSSLSSGISKL